MNKYVYELFYNIDVGIKYILLHPMIALLMKTLRINYYDYCNLPIGSSAKMSAVRVGVTLYYTLYQGFLTCGPLEVRSSLNTQHKSIRDMSALLQYFWIIIILFFFHQISTAFSWQDSVPKRFITNAMIYYRFRIKRRPSRCPTQ